MTNTMYSKLKERAIETAWRMNKQAEEGDLSRNQVNYGALSEIIYMMNQIGFDIEDCTYADGDYFKCAKIKENGNDLINFEK